MRTLLAAILMVAASLVSGAAGAGTPCRAAISAAEAEVGLPAHLLAAVALVESGRPDPLTGRTEPWPWTINVGGEGRFFASRAEAVAAVASLQRQSIRSIDVGCLQVNLAWHPDAFASLDDAFEPRANARYAARFLEALHAQTGSWARAAAAYHSQTPALAAGYQARVLALWPHAGEDAAPTDDSRYTAAFAASLRRMRSAEARLRADAQVIGVRLAQAP